MSATVGARWRGGLLPWRPGSPLALGRREAGKTDGRAEVAHPVGGESRRAARLGSLGSSGKREAARLVGGADSAPLPGRRGSGTPKGAQPGEHCTLPWRSVASLLWGSGLSNTAVGPRPKEKTPSAVQAAGLRVSKSMFPLWEERQGGAPDLHLPATEKGPDNAPSGKAYDVSRGRQRAPSPPAWPPWSKSAARPLLFSFLGLDEGPETP